MKSQINPLWRIIRAREKSLAASKKFYEDWIQQEQNRRKKVEAELKHLGGLLTQSERHVAAERNARADEMTAKDKARQSLQAEIEAHRRWEKLCREAEQQLTALRQQLAAETAAHVTAKKLLAQTEQHVTAERTSLQRELAAKEKTQQSLRAEAEARQRWEKLCHEAEQQLATLRQQLITETSVHAATKKLLVQTERQVTAERASRQQEAATKEKFQQSLQAEAEARQRWEKLCHEAEQQLATLRRQLATEVGAHAASKKNLTQTEQQVAAERATRQQEAAARKKIQQSLKAEAEARQQWEKLCREAEVQLAGVRQQLAVEAKASETARLLLIQTEQRADAIETDRRRELAAKEETQRALDAEVKAHQRWERLCHEAEAQLGTLKKQVAAEASAKTAAEKLLAEAGQRVVAVVAEHERELSAKAEAQRLLKMEVAAHQRWEKLCGEAEAQLAASKKQVTAEAAAKVVATKLLQQTEQRVATVETERQRELSAKEQTRRLLQSEIEAHQHWEKLCRDAEQQLAILKKQLVAEAGAKATAEKLLVQTEQRVVIVTAERQREMAVKEQALKSLEAEVAAQHRWKKLCREAEQQLDALGRQLAESRQQWEQECQARRQDAETKDKALAAVRMAEDANTHWAERHQESEIQRARDAQAIAEGARRLQELGAHTAHLQAKLDQQLELGAQQAQALTALHLEHGRKEAEISVLTSRLAGAAYAADLAIEQRRVERSRRTFLGRWLAFRNACARLSRHVYCLIKMKPFVADPATAAPRIAQVNTHDLIGGAERASYDLHVQYRQRGLKPSLTVGGKHGQDEDVFAMPFKPYDWKPAAIWRDRWGLTEILYPTPLKGCFTWPHLRQADVVHIHNMHGHYWNSATLLPLGLQHPLVLTLHDEYTMTGDCCYSYDCERWLRGCGKCPQIGLERGARYALGARDLTRVNIQIKRALFRAPRAYPLVITTPSHWLAERARRSPNLRHLPVISINNGVDLDFWRPRPQQEARQALGLPAGKTIALVVANHLSDRRKGFDCVLAAIRLLPRDTNLLFVIAGNLTDELKAQVTGLPVITVGFVSEKTMMRNLFSASDFTFSMSRMDNLPYMCVESLACGRPVFGSAVGGIPEIINEPALGWLTPLPFNHQEIAKILEEIDQEPASARRHRFLACRRSAAARFSLELMVDRYLALYHEIMSAAREGRLPDPTKMVRDQSILT